MTIQRVDNESPFPEARTLNDGTRAPNWYGGFSLETFANVGSLSYTHEDAQGWLDYVSRFQPLNFWYRDSNVGIWAYYEDFDNWQNTYGIDAVLAVYHSGHGGMGSDGRFYVPLGYNWGGQGTTAVSDRMRVGNERVNYLFWSTCESLRVLGGHSPIRTWQPANLGFRMLFGFETVSWDNPNYGKFFWEEWNKGKSFSSAWLDSSWRIAHDQAPSVVACGSTEAEARNRVFNERLFEWPHVSTNYWWWRWYNTSRSANMMRQPNLSLPQDLLIPKLKLINVDEHYIKDTLTKYKIEKDLGKSVLESSGDLVTAKGGKANISFEKGGKIDLQLAEPSIDNRVGISLDSAKIVAENAIREYGSQDEVQLVFDKVRLECESGGSTETREFTPSDPSITETTIHYRQVINGLPVITPGEGEFAISIDNDSVVTHVRSSVRPVESLSSFATNTTSTPADGEQATPKSNTEATDTPKGHDHSDLEALISKEWKKHMLTLLANGDAPIRYDAVTDSTEVGYHIKGNIASLAVIRAMEVDFGGGYRKRYWVISPIVE